MRERFLLPEVGVYLDGNSLGALPRGTPDRVRRVVEEEWGNGLIRSWNTHDWINASRRVGGMIAPLIGAAAHEVVVADSTSVNLYKLLVAALHSAPGRRTILSEPGNFPTDLYVADGAVRAVNGGRVKVVAVDDIISAIDEDVAVVMLTHVHYKSGRKLDMAAITEAAHARGALMLWDLSHSAGAVTVDLNGCNADLAVGCGYKYLNGGPGAPAFLFVAERHHGTLQSPLSGWLGHATPFAFTDDYAPAPDISRFLCGTPPIIALAALEEGVSLFSDVDFDVLDAKSRSLSNLYIELVEQRCSEFGFELITPRNQEQRGSHVSFRHESAYAICQALIARNIIGDFRAPDVLRMGFTPLYTSHEDVWYAVEALAAVMGSGEWNRPEFHERAAVT
jgi:kynureninase